MSISNRLKRKLQALGFIRITGLHNGEEGENIFRKDDLPCQILGTWRTVPLEGVRRVNDDVMTKRPTALLIITGDGEFILGQRPVLDHQQAPFKKLLESLAPNDEGYFITQLASVQLDAYELLERMGDWSWMPEHAYQPIDLSDTELSD